MRVAAAEQAARALPVAGLRASGRGRRRGAGRRRFQGKLRDPAPHEAGAQTLDTEGLFFGYGLLFGLVIKLSTTDWKRDFPNSMRVPPPLRPCRASRAHHHAEMERSLRKVSGQERRWSGRSALRLALALRGLDHSVTSDPRRRGRFACRRRGRHRGSRGRLRSGHNERRGSGCWRRRRNHTSRDLAGEPRPGMGRDCSMRSSIKR